MNELSNVSIKPLLESIYMKPVTMHFTLNGLTRSWDMLDIHDSVSIVLYNVTRNVLVLVRQFRPAVYFNAVDKSDRNDMIDVGKYPASLGVTIEWCAGIVDKDLPLEQIAKEEVFEECGYDVPLKSIQRVASYRSNVGASGSLQTYYYCEVTDDMKVGAGGGILDESIEVIEMTIPELKKHVTQSYVASPGSFLYGAYWFLYNKAR